MDANEIKEYSEDWYTLGRSFLPEFDDISAFARIAGESSSFAYETSPKSEKLNIRLTDKTQTAYADIDNDTIYLSTNYFNSKLYSKRFGVDGETEIEKLAISLINGSVIHEALHFAHTEDSTIPMALGRLEGRSRVAIEKFGLKIVCTAFNIIEDLYIEAQVPANLEKWLQGTSDILFSAKDLKKEWNLGDIGEYLNLAILFKNKELRNEPEFSLFSDESKLALRKAAASRKRTMTARVGLALDFLDAFVADESETGGDAEGDGGDDGETETKESETGESIESEESETEESKESETEESEESETEEDIPTDANASCEMKEILGELDEMSEEDFEDASEEIKEASDEIAEENSETEEFKAGPRKISWKKLVEKDVLEIPKTYASINPKTEINFSFLKELAAIRTLNRTPGQARNRGSVMVKSRLTRIATDGKIFAKRDAQRQTLKRMEVIINIDLSGSTYGAVANNELGSAMAISKVLRSAGIAHSVYGHSTEGRSTPLLVHIYSYDMVEDNKDWDARFERARHIDLVENYDGVVIKKLGEKFTEKQATRYIINLSDGLPCGPGYHGATANAHTRKEIKDLRNRGVGVFAISVVEHVVSKNDNIYGKDFNIDGSKNTNSQFQTLIKKLALGA